MNTLAIVGGSSPFTVELFHQLALTELREQPYELRLHGRNLDALELVRYFAVATLPAWRILATPHLDEALDDADIVVHQARYGGLGGRFQDELLAASLNTLADETLGPGGLQAALRIAEGVLAFSSIALRQCPDAWILNLVNPLGISTSLIAGAGLQLCLGLCELPTVTHRLIADLLGVTVSELAWDYVGLNHRGFLYNLRVGDENVLPRLLTALCDERAENGVCGIGSELIAQLDAVPLKYFKMLNGQPIHVPGRAHALKKVRDRAYQELRQRPVVYPTSIRARSMPWYEHAVVPTIAALLGHAPSITCTANIGGSNDIAQERMVRMDRGKLTIKSPSQPPPLVAAWMDRFCRHEESVLTATRCRTRAAVIAALKLDPLLRCDQVRIAADLIDV
ncbi:6-phospho-beta-glucosidase [Candidatus Burkholderia pumila]|uniref:6-phospho-beta-glucosidase n=1 Tax=Candidatus Burkholderia pumila TaxID=1090375 RepID=A0ABR5HKM5_9BURK|nr:6-phospho-beta-glucosidase [Candidatus Burkholderia pumila]